MAKISIEIKDEVLKVIDKARKIDVRSRTNFLVSSALKEANRQLKKE
ncbi:MAG: DUF1778 domain-containing protein [Candidatus Woesearchaeota archaeon]|jgi:uncharacterized protein (DUF1778 family)|nr:DUF1778 domain-containing protein [Candidatus Woesearchaeota archaeon]